VVGAPRSGAALAGSGGRALWGALVRGRSDNLSRVVAITAMTSLAPRAALAAATGEAAAVTSTGVWCREVATASAQRQRWLPPVLPVSGLGLELVGHEVFCARVMRWRGGCCPLPPSTVSLVRCHLGGGTGGLQFIAGGAEVVLRAVPCLFQLRRCRCGGEQAIVMVWSAWQAWC
jgi:hypothetical protein